MRKIYFYQLHYLNVFICTCVQQCNLYIKHIVRICVYFMLHLYSCLCLSHTFISFIVMVNIRLSLAQLCVFESKHSGLNKVEKSFRLFYVCVSARAHQWDTIEMCVTICCLCNAYLFQWLGVMAYALKKLQMLHMPHVLRLNNFDINLNKMVEYSDNFFYNLIFKYK